MILGKCAFVYKECRNLLRQVRISARYVTLPVFFVSNRYSAISFAILLIPIVEIALKISIGAVEKADGIAVGKV